MNRFVKQNVRVYLFTCCDVISVAGVQIHVIKHDGRIIDGCFSVRIGTLGSECAPRSWKKLTPSLPRTTYLDVTLVLKIRESLVEKLELIFFFEKYAPCRLSIFCVKDSFS